MKRTSRMVAAWMLCAAAPLFAQPVPVAHASVACSGGGCSAVTTPAIDTRGATLIVLASSAQGTIVGFQDSQGNIWKPLTRYGSNPGVQLAYCDPCLTSASQTFTNTSVVNPSFAVAAFSGTVASGAFNVESGLTSPTSPISPALTTSQAGELVLTAIAHQSPSPVSVDSMFSVIEQQAFSQGNHFGISLAWKVEPTAGSIAPEWTTQASGGRAAIAAFKQPCPGGASACGSVALPTSAIPAGQCSPLVPIPAPGARALLATPVPDMTTVAGYAPSTSGSLYITPVVGSSQGFKVCSNSAGPITPGVLSLNWSAF